jgi:periplasmic protein TonB
MGYQALLFCPDEKVAHVVTQVFSELDFNVELVNEPFGAVKKLMAQHYDAIAVDCENEQNATLLFKSARNSQANQSALALALVEGQAGVAKAYRIGANLLLTKPINVEQAKGTLRVARGLLRKNSDVAGTSAKPAASAAAPITPAPETFPEPEERCEQPLLPAKLAFAASQLESSLPGMAASAKVEEKAVAPPASSIPARFSPEVNSPAEFQLPAPAPEFAEPAAAPAVPAKKPVVTFANVRGAAAAPAPAREVPAPAEKRATKPAPMETSSAPAGRTLVTAAPTFSALDESEAREGSGGAKKIVTIAAVLAVAAALGYFGWTKFGQPAEARHPQSIVERPFSAQPAAPLAPSPAAPSPAAPSPAAPSPAAPSISTSGMPAAASRPAVVSPGAQPAKPSASAGNLPTVRIAANPEPLAIKPAPVPIRVKSEPAKAQAGAEESAVPSPLGVASANERALNGLVSSAPASLPKAVPGTLKISQGVSQGLLIRRVQPTYPATALAMRVHGVVQLEATINKEGSITNLKTVSGDQVLARAATAAVKQWRYKPYYLNGEPVEIQTQITVNFRLPN